MEIFAGREVNESALAGLNQIQHVVQRSFALGIPEHQPTLRLLSHSDIFRGIVAEVSAMVWCFDPASGPRPNVISTLLHAKNGHVAIAMLRKIGLHSFVRSIRIAYQNRATTLHQAVQPRLDGGI